MITGATLLALALTAQPGVPEPPPRTAAEAAWLTWGNDWFGVPGERTDDHRTNEFAAGLRRNGWVVCVDNSMLTVFGDDRGRQHGRRLDEATLTVGREVCDDLTLGVGLRYRGNLGGEGLQNWWHRTLGETTVSGEYERGGTALVGYGLWRRVFRPAEYFCPEVLAGVLASTDAEVSADVAARLVWYTRSDVTVWAGLRYRVRSTDFGSRAVDATAAYERGPCYEFGFSLGRALAFESTYSVPNRAAVGALTFTADLP
jgi:hypothetical protein